MVIRWFHLVPAAVAMLCGCATVSKNPVTDAQTTSAEHGTPGRVEVILSDGERKKVRQVALSDGALRTLAYRDDRETWFRTHVQRAGQGGAVSLRHRAKISISQVRDTQTVYYTCRGWIGFDRPLPDGYRLTVTERIVRADNSKPLVSRELVPETLQTGRRFIELFPWNQRTVALSTAEEDGTLTVGYDVVFTGGSSEVVAKILLSPRLMTAAEWQLEGEARTDVVLLAELGDSRDLQRFADLYLNTAGDYVEAHLPYYERVHCYLQADLVRAWYREVIAQHPEIHRAIVLTGLRRSPYWQSSNLLTPRDGRSALSYLRRGDGVVLDTWRADGGTETKIQSVQEFRKPLNIVRLEDTVTSPAGPRP